MNNKIIDLEMVIQFAGSEEFARELLEMLAENLPQHIQEIAIAYQKNDLDALAKAAHKLHGATCYTGTAKLKEAVKAVELAAKAGQTNDINVLIEQFNTEANLFEEAWQAMK